VLIAFLTGSVALFGFGVYLLIDSVTKLVMAEHPTIQTVELFGTRVWLGWPMIVALAYSVVPPFVLGRMKLPLATELHDKGLETSATLNKGDWLAGIAGIAGILGIAYGFWWADAAAAGLISFEIAKDGFANLHNSVSQLMNKRPTEVDSKTKDPVPDKVRDEIRRLPWVDDAAVRLREDGDVIAGEVFVVPTDDRDLLERLRHANEVVRGVDWRLDDVNVVPVRSLDEGQDGKPVLGVH
jgi:divalent metal cation (Fe/Co/Zn/Cd) transporter